MGEFTEQVQSGKVVGPLRRSFTPQRWKKAFATAVTPDDTDKDVYAAGLVIHEKLQNIRDRLNLSTSSGLSATTKLRAFIAASNHNYLVTRDKAKVAVSKAGEARAHQSPDGFRLEELTAVKLKLLGGSDWTPNEVVESLVDGIEIPIRFTLQATPDLAGSPHMNKVEWKDIALELNLGIMYRQVEDLWDDCLWNRYKLNDNGRVKVFLPQDRGLKLGYILGLSRRSSLSMTFTIMATKFHRQMVAEGKVPKIREARAIERQGKRQIIKLSKPGEPTGAFEELAVMRGYASEPYYTELLDEPLPALGGLTLSKLLDAWIVLSRTALVLVEGVEKVHAHVIKQDRPANTWLPQYAPVLQVSALVDVLFAAAGIKHADGKRLIEFFTFRGQSGQEIWAQPLVPVGPTTIAPLFAAVVSPNLRRLVDVWLRQVGVDLAKRGPAFEAYVRGIVAESISTSKLLSGCAMSIKEDYTFKPSDGRKEQIDLLFSLGATVFVAEAKCILEPTEAKGVAMHRKTVEGAAEQVLRKARSLEENRAEFIVDVKRFGIDLPQDFQVIPLVIVSTSTHVGIASKGVAVIDELILERFINGEIEDQIIEGHDFAVQKRIKTLFYSDATEAQAKAQHYFSSPPQLKRFLNGMVNRIIPIHSINEQDWEGYFMTLDCLPSDDPQIV
jgi:hypothetical protein